jgi:hypothetical protein
MAPKPHRTTRSLLAGAARSALVLALLATTVPSSASTGRLVGGAPKPLRGVQLNGATGIRLLVSSNPPFLLDVDAGGLRPISGLPVGDKPVLSVHAVGKDAVIWLDRRASGAKVPRAEIYVVRRGTTTATRLGTGWDVAPAVDGRAVWLKSFIGAARCVLREVDLDGRPRRAPRRVRCSTRLVDAGAGALLVRGSSVVDPRTGRVLDRAGGALAMAGRFVLTTSAPHGPLRLIDLRSGRRWRLGWPSRIGRPGSQGGTDEAAVQKKRRLIALSFSDPAYQGGGTQVVDVWLLDPATLRFRQLPDMPADVELKFTSMSWTSDGRLVMLARTAGRTVVAVWRPGQSRIAVRSVRLPARDSGSDLFVAWTRT